MRDVALDLLTWDLALSGGQAALTSGVGAIAQKVRVRVSLAQGEYRLDTTRGIPFSRLFARKDDGALLVSTLRAALASTPGLASLDAFAFTPTGRRAGSVRFAGRAGTGEPVSLDAFAVGST